VCFIVVLSCLYHNDNFYRSLKNKYNPKILKTIGWDVLSDINGIAHSFDFVGVVKKGSNPLKESNYIDIKIDSTNETKLNKYLSAYPSKKKWFQAKVLTNGYYQSAKMKLHGTDPTHHKKNKFSLTIKLYKDSSTYINNFRRFKLIKGEEADPTIISINKIASSIGMISTFGEMKILRINGVEMGDYYFVEDLKKEYLEREFGIINFGSIGQVADWTRKEYYLGQGHLSDNDLYYGHIEKNKGKLLHAESVNQYKMLCEHLKSNNVEKVKELIDTEYIGKYLALASIFNDLHFMTGDNVKLIYDFNRGKFYPIYRAEFPGSGLNKTNQSSFGNYNKLLFNHNVSEYDKSITKLYSLLLTDSDVRNARDEALNLIANEKDDFINKLRLSYEDNQNVMLHTNRSRRKYYIKKLEQIELVKSTLSLANEYLNYAHVYGSYDSTSRQLNVLIDAFSSFSIHHKTKGKLVNHVHGISFDRELNQTYNYKVIEDLSDTFRLKDIFFVNNVTGDTLSKHIHLNYTNSKDQWSTQTTLEMLEYAQIDYQLKKDTLTILKGKYSCDTNIVITKNYFTQIQAGVTLKLNSGANFIVEGSIQIKGTEEEKVRIENVKEGEPFGTFAVLGKNDNTCVEMNHIHVSGGSESYYRGHLFTGQLAIYYSNVIILNSTFEHSHGDDGLNIKHSKVAIDNCYFINNKADQVDLDFSIATISNSHFSPSLIDYNGDGMDFSGSYAKVSNCSFDNFVDKGLSLGERSRVLISQCKFANNASGITVKDQTTMFAWNNTFTSNSFNYSSYIKKKIFNEPQLFFNNGGEKMNVIEGNIHGITLDDWNNENDNFSLELDKYYASNDLSQNKSLNKIIEF
jgi:hypothetical protein